MALAIWALIRPRERGALYASTRLEEYRQDRDWNRRGKELRNEPFKPPLAIEITGPDIKAIEALSAKANRMDGVSLIKALYTRVGAATTLTPAPDTVPLYDHEIRTVERLVTAAFDGPYTRTPDSAQQLLNKLHALEGRARAMTTVNGIPVTRPALES